MAAAKARGVTLGNPKIDEARQKAAAEIVDHADQRAANVIPIMRQIQRSGATSLRQIAEALNARGISAPRGGQWHATSIRNVMARAWLEAMEVGPFDSAGLPRVGVVQSHCAELRCARFVGVAGLVVGGPCARDC